jgi:hypothetical protein
MISNKFQFVGRDDFDSRHRSAKKKAHQSLPAPAAQSSDGTLTRRTSLSPSSRNRAELRSYSPAHPNDAYWTLSIQQAHQRYLAEERNGRKDDRDVVTVVGPDTRGFKLRWVDGKLPGAHGGPSIELEPRNKNERIYQPRGLKTPGAGLDPGVYGWFERQIKTPNGPSDNLPTVWDDSTNQDLLDTLRAMRDPPLNSVGSQPETFPVRLAPDTEGRQRSATVTTQTSRDPRDQSVLLDRVDVKLPGFAPSYPFVRSEMDFGNLFGPRTTSSATTRPSESERRPVPTTTRDIAASGAVSDSAPAFRSTTAWPWLVELVPNDYGLRLEHQRPGTGEDGAHALNHLLQSGVVHPSEMPIGTLDGIANLFHAVTGVQMQNYDGKPETLMTAGGAIFRLGPVDGSAPTHFVTVLGSGDQWWVLDSGVPEVVDSDPPPFMLNDALAHIARRNAPFNHGIEYLQGALPGCPLHELIVPSRGFDADATGLRPRAGVLDGWQLPQTLPGGPFHPDEPSNRQEITRVKSLNTNYRTALNQFFGIMEAMTPRRDVRQFMATLDRPSTLEFVKTVMEQSSLVSVANYLPRALAAAFPVRLKAAFEAHFGFTLPDVRLLPPSDLDVAFSQTDAVLPGCPQPDAGRTDTGQSDDDAWHIQAYTIDDSLRALTPPTS